MNRWLKQNLNLTIIATLISSVAMGVATAAVMHSDIEMLKHNYNGVPEALARIEQHQADMQKSVDRIEDNLIEHK